MACIRLACDHVGKAGALRFVKAVAQELGIRIHIVSPKRPAGEMEVVSSTMHEVSGPTLNA